jgi:hypothetical protein
MQTAGDEQLQDGGAIHFLDKRHGVSDFKLIKPTVKVLQANNSVQGQIENPKVQQGPATLASLLESLTIATHDSMQAGTRVSTKKYSHIRGAKLDAGLQGATGE